MLGAEKGRSCESRRPQVERSHALATVMLGASKDKEYEANRTMVHEDREEKPMVKTTAEKQDAKLWKEVRKNDAGVEHRWAQAWFHIHRVNLQVSA